jgi:hypothetical protein
MSFWGAYLIVVVGILISFAIPALKRLIWIQPPERADIKRFAYIGLFSLLTALLVMAFGGDSLLQDWRAALLAGYAWDSTFQKIGT